MEPSKVTLRTFSKLEQQLLSHCQTPCMKTRLLCIDGGGTTGIVACASLVHLERQIRLRVGNPSACIADFFDIVAGTGIGAILASMLVSDDGSGRPLFSACDALAFLTARRAELFCPKPAGILRRGRRFSCSSMEMVLKEAFTREDGKALTLRDTCKPLIVPCFDLRSSAPFVFSRADATESASFDFELWKVCRATSATPGLFRPFDFSSVDGKTCCSAVDGGIVMNNPPAAAVTHVLHNKRDFPSASSVEDLLVLSLGNGASSLGCSSLCSSTSGKPKLRRSGACSTLTVVNVVVDGVSETVDQMLGNAFCWNRADYVRIQANGLKSEGRVGMKISNEGERMLQERGVETLPFGGKQLLTETNGERIERFAQRLVASGRSSLPPSPCQDSSVPVNSLANGC